MQHCRFSCWRLQERIKHTSELRRSAKKKSQLPSPSLPSGGGGGEKAAFPPGPLHPVLPNELMQQHHHLSNWLQPWSSPDFLQIPTGRKPFFLSVFPRNSWQAWHSYSWKCSIGHLLEESADWWNWTDLVLRAVRCSLPLSWYLGTCLCSVPRSPPLPRPPHPLPPAVHQPVSNLLWTKVATGLSVLGTVFPSWQHYRGCLVLPEQLLREGKCPQTVNCRTAPFAHKHQCHGNFVHIQGQACAWQSGAWERGLSHCAVPACPLYKQMLEMSF